TAGRGRTATSWCGHRFEVDEHRVSQADPCLGGQRLLGPGLRDALRALDRRRDGHAVDRSAPEADVLDEEPAARIGAQPQVLPGYLGARHDLDVDPGRAAATAD